MNSPAIELRARQTLDGDVKGVHLRYHSRFKALQDANDSEKKEKPALQGAGGLLASLKLDWRLGRGGGEVAPIY